MEAYSNGGVNVGAVALCLVLPLKTSATIGLFIYPYFFTEAMHQAFVVRCNVGDIDDDDVSMY